jgi:hypothetical protein
MRKPATSKAHFPPAVILGARENPEPCKARRLSGKCWGWGWGWGLTGGRVGWRGRRRSGCVAPRTVFRPLRWLFGVCGA